MEDKFMQNVRLLLRDLSARLPYGVVCEACSGEMRRGRLTGIDVSDWDEDCRPLCEILVDEETMEIDGHEIDDLRPYLYPREKGIKKYREDMEECGAIEPFFCIGRDGKAHSVPGYPVAYVGFCLENHIDYLGLLDIGWAVEITEENNPYIQKQKTK